MCIKTIFDLSYVKAKGVPKIVFLNNPLYVFEIIKIIFYFSQLPPKEMTFLRYN